MDYERLKALFRSLAEHKVGYAVFGAVALGLQGLARTTEDLDLFIVADRENVERLKDALRSVFDDPNIDQISADDLCGDYPAVRYYPPKDFGIDIVTRLGEAFRFEDLETEEKLYDGVPVRVISAHTLWRMKKGTIRPIDRIDADALAQRFGFREK